MCGLTVFGPGRSVNEEMRENPIHRLKRVGSLVLNNAILSPESMAVLCPGRGFFDASIENLAMWNGCLSAADRNFIELANDAWRWADPSRPIPEIDTVVLPVGGIGIGNYGHFLYDGLPAALLHRLLLGPHAVLAGRPLLPWQSEILDALGLLDGYVALDRPTRFRKIVTSDMVSFNVQYPSRFVCAVFDRLRFRFGTGTKGRQRLLISRALPENRRVMENRPEIEAVAAEFGFEMMQPARMTIAEQARLFAEADCVIGESGAALANLGFCDPGTNVLEIQPERFADGWTRAACHVLGLRWHVFFACVTGEPGDGPVREFGFTVDPVMFRKALAEAFPAR
ncbi:glycosyltransferase family 61 protein [Acidiphilium sp. AL]|uniref:glycosyltransferase family 61 protein n=1 Tax=Acidiphilium sp. AL TaxID=2871704 RepID=UPI0021CB7E73|nr:glycosyltransferase family 61 protein [Acidiphilium sp. AL]MCU4160437.1 glycosyltransferase family 61 protein [Acidiphilium sp. AL]